MSANTADEGALAAAYVLLTVAFTAQFCCAVAECWDNVSSEPVKKQNECQQCRRRARHKRRDCAVDRAHCV